MRKLVLLVVMACGGGPKTYEIVAGSSGATSVAAGDALALQVKEVSSGVTVAVPSTAQVTFSTPPAILALPPASLADSRIPAPGAAPTVGFVSNPGRPELGAALNDVLFVFDPGTSGGTVTVTASIDDGTTSTAMATTTLTVVAAPVGDARSGQLLYASNCAVCHGATGHGTDPVDGGTQYFINGKLYDFPAPGLNAEEGNAGSDPGWNAALFAVSARCDVDNGGLTLRAPMPAWVTDDGADGKLISTQDFADIYAYMQMQSQ